MTGEVSSGQHQQPLPAPHPTLEASVVVPARNEAATIEACLEALATQQNLPHEIYEVLLVIDHCTDDTEVRARQVSDQYPTLRLHFLRGPGLGSGHARRTGMDAARDRLLGLGKPGALIASTDADSVVAPDWLVCQLQAARQGSRAIGGRIDLRDDGAISPELLRWHTDRGAHRLRQVLADPRTSGRTEHWQFSGASLALTAAAYDEVGGIEARESLEDESLEEALLDRGIGIDRLLRVRVTTSARLAGRADRGLAADLSAAATMLVGRPPASGR